MAVHILPTGLTPDPDRPLAGSTCGPVAGAIDREWSLAECCRILYRRRVPLLSIAVVGVVIAALATAFQPRMYQSRASIQILGLNENFLSLRDIYPTTVPGADNVVYIQTQAEILRQDSLVEHVIEELRLDQHPEFRNSSKILDQVRNHVQIVLSRGSSIIQIVCESRDPKLAAELANTLAQTFIDQSVEARQRSARETQASLSLERAALGKRLAESEAAFNAYSRSGTRETGNDVLKRQLDANRQFYQFISQRMDEARIASTVEQSNARLVSAARPAAHPYKPNLPLNLLLGAIGGLVLAIGYVMLREQTRLAWRTPAEAAACLSVPSLGTIPKVITRSPFRLPVPGAAFSDTPIECAPLQQSSSAVVESFRSAAASIFAAGNNSGVPRLLAFTSPRPGEGNTTVVSNLAVAFAETGSKVLVIDADLRRPRQHEIFDQPNSRGLSDLLREKNAVEELPLDALVKRTTVPRLYLLPGGTSVDNIFALLWSGRFARLLPRFHQGFDYVLIDAPPCLEFTDARIIARFAETVVLVLRPDRTSKEDAQTAVQRFQLDGIPVMGVILNAWDLS